MRKFLTIFVLLLVTVQLFAQEKGKIRAGVDLGLSLPGGGFGLTGDVDVRYNILDNVNAGVRFGMLSIAKDIDTDNNTGVVQGGLYFMVNGDYYFHKPNNNFAPFVGAGAGSFGVLNMKFTEDSKKFDKTPSVSGKFGGLIRGGFEYGKFRLALEYFMIPSSDLYDTKANKIGTAKNSFINLSIGFFLGGGKWVNSPTVDPIIE